MLNAKGVRICVVVATALVLAPAVMLAQEDLMHVPVSVSFFPPLSTSGVYAWKVSTNFSLNIIGGYVGAVKGCEIGSVFNIDIRGMEGCQLGGVLNVVAGDARGFQAAGVMNVVVGEVRGAQLAGPLNLAVGDCPVQLGVTNVAIGENHAQIGVVNFAGNAKGLQLGVVNVAGRNDGVPLGIVSVAGNSRFHANVWVDETSLLNVALKILTGRIYNVYALGYNPIGDPLMSKFGLGLGTHIPLDPFFVDIDAVQYNVAEGIRFWNQEGYNGLTTVHFTGGWQVLPGLAVTAGPSINIWFSTERDGEDVRNFGLLIADYDGAETYTDIWLGFSLGLELF